MVGATVIDGTGASPVRDAVLLLDGDRIVSVGPAGQTAVPEQAEVIDAAGKYVIPGLMDANVHLVLHCDPDVLLRNEPGCYDELVLEAAQVALRAGLTTVFDTWGPLESLLRVRDRIDAGTEVGSRIYFAGNIIGNDGPWSEDFYPYADQLNSVVAAQVNAHWEQSVGAELTWMPAEDVRAAVREYIATSGIDFVKYASSSHRHFRFIALSPDAQRAIVEEAHAAGMTAQACSLAPEALKLAIQSGVDLLQHGDTSGRYPMPEETMRLIVDRQLPCVALLKTERHIEAVRSDVTLPDHWRALLSVKDDNARRLIAAGAKLLMASDGGVFERSVTASPWWGGLMGLPDIPLHLGTAHLLWLRAAIERGMTPMDALLAATRNIAQAYGRIDEIGTLEPGKQADLVVLDGDPLADVENYGRVVLVLKDGVPVDRDALPTRPVLTAKGDVVESAGRVGS